MLYIVVPTFNRIDIMNNFIKQIKMQTYKEYKLVIVDHGTIDFKCNDLEVTCVKTSPDKWWAGAVNEGLRYVLKNFKPKNSDLFLVINDDVIINEDYLENAINEAEKNPNCLIGSVCFEYYSKLTHDVNIILDKKNACFRLMNQGLTLKEIELFETEELKTDVLTGRGVIIPCGIIKKIGLYNEKKLPHYFSDFELPWRAKKMGYNLVVSKKMIVYTIVDSYNVYDNSLSMTKNLKKIFFDMKSLNRISDSWNLAKLCFTPIYALYFTLINFMRGLSFFAKGALDTKKMYVLPLNKIKDIKKIAIYAAGKVGTSYYNQIINSKKYKLIGMFDQNYKKFINDDKPVYDPNTISDYDFDVIVIAIENVNIARETAKYLMKLGVPKEKIVWSIKHKYKFIQLIKNNLKLSMKKWTKMHYLST